MESSPPFPKYIFKILPEAPPSPLPHHLPLSDLDQKDGFIHLSTGWRCPITADMFFASFESLWLLKLDFDVARGEKATFKWGDPGCIHMYADKAGEWARLGEGIVLDAREFKRGKDEKWADAFTSFETSQWLADS